jgi:N-acetylglutamate synthase-like GNAT family acetyltransferase
MIRPFQMTDTAALLQLFSWNTPEYFGEEEVAHFETYLASKPTDFFVMELDNVIVGCAGYGYQEDNCTGQVSWFVFHPEYQGQGLGREILNFCLAQLSQHQEMQKVIVRTSQLVEGFFSKAGFKTTHIEKDYWAPGYDLYVMELQHLFTK